MEPVHKTQDKNEEWYDEVYFDSDQDSEEDSPGIGLMGKQKKTPSMLITFFF